jgi:hypothetical protein
LSLRGILGDAVVFVAGLNPYDATHIAFLVDRNRGEVSNVRLLKWGLTSIEGFVAVVWPPCCWRFWQSNL